MRLARKLAKTVIVLAVAAAALGGAVALGSTLFERPPRDAAEFAARADGVAATGRRAGTALPAGKRRSTAAKARARYVRALDASCRRQIGEFEALGRPQTLAELETYLERVLALARRYDGESLGVRTPPALRDEEARYEALSGEGLDLLERMLDAARRSDPDTIALLGTRLLDVADRQNEQARRIGALDCVVEAPVASY